MNRLLRKNISAWQIGGYAVAMLVGLVIVLVAFQFYRDVAGAFGADGQEELVGARNLVISKPVGIKSTLTGKTPGFSPEDIADIESQPWAGKVAPFQAADFRVWAGVDFGGRNLSTSLFFESLPDDVVDVDLSKWTFDPSQPEIPILVSKDYLTLYNMGFAPSGGMPVVSQDMLGSIPLTVRLSGNGRSEVFPARIVGFSSWLNTVAVPQRFMDWAHGRFGGDDVPQPSRLVVEVTDGADPTVNDFMANRGYEVAGPQADLGRAAYFLRVVTSVIAGVGGVIALLALGILLLSLFLLVQKNRRTISTLLLLGYSCRAVSAGYIRLLAVVNSCVLVLACAAVLLVRGLWTTPLSVVGLEPSSVFPTIAAAVAVMLVVTAVNIVVVRRLVGGCFRA